MRMGIPDLLGMGGIIREEVGEGSTRERVITSLPITVVRRASVLLKDWKTDWQIFSTPWEEVVVVVGLVKKLRRVERAEERSEAKYE